MEIFGNILVGISGLAWTIVYLDLIRKGFKEKACGMPLIALTLNLAWEILYGLDGLFFSKSFILVQSIANVAWALCDVFILLSWFLYGRQYMPDRAKGYFIPFTILAIAFGVLMQFAFYFHFESKEEASIYSAFAQNAAMSLLFLAMLFQRDDLRGQSLLIGICKCLGTLTPTIYGNLGGINIYILLTGILCFVLDVIYIYFLIRFRRKPRAEETTPEAARLP
ncbi:MAG: hypothetical protein Q4F15_05250 [Bacillota bacterium]|nr:hypothetical protein [Bacillota bacterium]